MKKEFAPYELAVKLKELGFDEECAGLYEEVYNNIELLYARPIVISYLLNTAKHEGRIYHCKAPLWQQAFDWFREKYKLKVGIGINNKNLYYTYKIVMFETTEEYYKECFKTHQEARQACLEKLIELCGTL